MEDSNAMEKWKETRMRGTGECWVTGSVSHLRAVGTSSFGGEKRN